MGCLPHEKRAFVMTLQASLVDGKIESLQPCAIDSAKYDVALLNVPSAAASTSTIQLLNPLHADRSVHASLHETPLPHRCPSGDGDWQHGTIGLDLWAGPLAKSAPKAGYDEGECCHRVDPRE